MPNKKTPATTSHILVPVELIDRHIYLIRGQKVMLDSDLAKLYQVPTKALNQAVKRNIDRFPDDFIFRLTSEEVEALNRSQFVTGSQKHRTAGLLPSAFTELGVAMLSSVLNSHRAVQVNIVIMRAFVKLRELLATHKDLAQKIEQMEVTQKDHAVILALVVKDIQTLAKGMKREFKKLKSPRRQKARIGFPAPGK